MLDVLFWVLTTIGAVTVLLGLLALGTIAICALQGRKQEQESRQWHTIGRAYMRQRLLNDAWWFSEDEPTMNVLKRLGEGDSVDRVRTDWRAERKPKLQAAAEGKLCR